MKILYIARNFPFPPNRGERMRDYYFIKYLAEKNSVTLVARLYDEKDFQYLRDAETLCDHLIVRYIPKSNNIFRAISKIYKPLLIGEPLITGTMCFPQIGRDVYRELNRRKYDVVQIEHTPLSYYLNFIPLHYDGIKVIDLHNVESLRLKRLQNVCNNVLYRVFLNINFHRMKSYEFWKLQEYDHIFTVSKKEKEIVKGWLPNKEVTVLPNPIDFSDIEEINPYRGINKANELLFVGSMNYAANEDAMIWFIKHILPNIKRNIPNVCLTIVGHNPSIRLKKFESADIVVTGSVLSIKPYYLRASIFIVPLRAGGGSRLKILEAIKYGLPVISTSIGAEGLNLENGTDILIVDKPNEFANSIFELLRNPDLRYKLVKNAQQKIRKLYDWRVVGAHLYEALYQSIVKKRMNFLPPK